MGQALSRLADWQTDMLADALTCGAGRSADTPRRGGGGGVTLLPKLQKMQSYVWRRHLASTPIACWPATAGREIRVLAVGFADLVGYTSRSRGMGAQLAAMVEDFESTAAEVISRHRGRVGKTVGDGVLFTTATPLDAVAIGPGLPVAWDTEDRPPLAGRRCVRVRAHSPR